MPHTSRTTAAESISLFGIDVKLANLDGGYTVCFESHANNQDLGPLFDGLAEGARLVEFSPTEELGQAIAVVMANVERGRTPLQLSSRT